MTRMCKWRGFAIKRRFDLEPQESERESHPEKSRLQVGGTAMKYTHLQSVLR